jgi:putative addiction module killer protein
MIQVHQSETYAKWSRALRDQNAKDRIDIRILRLQAGNFGDVKSVGEGVRELRIDYGPGYRVYFVQCGDLLVILLCGGDKHTQAGCQEHGEDRLGERHGHQDQDHSMGSG